jgi:hypothetical protein
MAALANGVPAVRGSLVAAGGEWSLEGVVINVADDGQVWIRSEHGSTVNCAAGPVTATALARGERAAVTLNGQGVVCSAAPVRCERSFAFIVAREEG